MSPFHAVSLAEARENAELSRAMRLKASIASGALRSEQKARAIEVAQASTFKKCAEGCIDAHNAGWNNAKHADRWTATRQTYV